jgi:hypothetical protein
VDEFVRAQEEIRQGNFVLAEAILDTVLYRSDEITSHLLFDLTGAYEELFRATDRYEDLIRISQRFVKRARHLPEMDTQIHSAHALIVVAGTEIALGRRDDAERNIHAAQRSLKRFPAERFGANSRARVNSMRVRLKSLQKVLSQDALVLPSNSEPAGSNSKAGDEEWRAFASQSNLSGKDVKTWLAILRRSAGSPATLTIVVEWALSTPRVGNIGASSETLATFVDELASITVAHPLPLDSQRKLFQVLHDWDKDQGPWLQRLISANRKSGLAEKLQRLRRALESRVQFTLNSLENRLCLLESSDVGKILDGGGDQDYEADLLRLDADLSELKTFVPSPPSSRLRLLQNRLTSVLAAVDHEILRRNEVYAQLFEAVARASSAAALADLKMAIKQQLPATMRERRELQEGIRQADDRVLMAELKGLEVEERAALRAKLDSVRGVDLANLLLRNMALICRTHGDSSLIAITAISIWNIFWIGSLRYICVYEADNAMRVLRAQSGRPN